MYLYILKVSLTTKDIQPEISGTRTRYPKSHRHVDQIELLRLDWLWIGARVILAPCSHKIANHLLQAIGCRWNWCSLNTMGISGEKTHETLTFTLEWTLLGELLWFGSSCGWMRWVDGGWVVVVFIFQQQQGFSSGLPSWQLIAWLCLISPAKPPNQKEVGLDNDFSLQPLPDQNQKEVELEGRLDWVKSE